jgi:hypothetical protein
MKQVVAAASVVAVAKYCRMKQVAVASAAAAAAVRCRLVRSVPHTMMMTTLALSMELASRLHRAVAAEWVC